ncbi:MAG: hypothetical protein N3A69_01960 [Leptospiraceae bacterium]|nr:hypothetical protein [Leptospiraceae bacterium]
MFLPFQLKTQESSFSNLDTLVTSSLSVYLEEEDEYYKLITSEDWYEEWDFKKYDPNIYSHGLHQYSRQVHSTTCKKAT